MAQIYAHQYANIDAGSLQTWRNWNNLADIPISAGVASSGPKQAIPGCVAPLAVMAVNLEAALGEGVLSSSANTKDAGYTIQIRLNYGEALAAADYLRGQFYLHYEKVFTIRNDSIQISD